MKKLFLSLVLMLAGISSAFAGLSNYEQNLEIDALMRGQTYTFTTSYVGLLTCTNGPIARSTTYALNNTVTYVAADGVNHLYKVTTAGTTAASAPTYPGAKNEVITDGTEVMTEQTSALQAETAEVEPSGGSYARVSYTNSLTNWSGTQGTGTTVASSGTSATTYNNAIISYVTPTANWAVSPAAVWGFAIYDAATAGHVRRWAPFSADVYIASGNSVAFQPNALSINIDY